MPQRRAALARAATGVWVVVGWWGFEGASTKGCSRESSDQLFVLADGVRGVASTKGCSRESSDGFRYAGWTDMDRRLNEGLLSREQRRPAGCCSARPVARCLNEGLLSREQRPDPRGVRPSAPRSLNEGLLSREQRRGRSGPSRRPRGPPQRRAALARAATTDRMRRGPPSTDEPQRRAALARAATGTRRAGCREVRSLNEGLLSREQRPARCPTPATTCGSAASTKGCSRESSDRRALRGGRRLPRGLNEGLLSREQRPQPQRRPRAPLGLNEGLLSREQRLNAGMPA